MSFKLHVHQLKKSFGNTEVLKDISLNVKMGESLVILGGSGSGKSVLLKTMLGLIEPDAGIIKIGRQSLHDLNPQEKQILLHKMGMLFQGGALFDSLPVWENIAFRLLLNLKLPIPKAKNIALEKLHAVGLEQDVMYKYPSELSGGMRKRVALARAIASDPEILFFDEPTTGLDPIMCEVIDKLICQCVSQLGATTITITHDLTSAFYIADRIALLHQGRIAWIGSVHDVETTDNPVMQQFLSAHKRHRPH